MTLTMTAPEIRTFAALELRAAKNDAGLYSELIGRAVPYREFAMVGWYAEAFERGAFDKSIEESAKALPLLMWHNNETWPIGAAVDWRSGLDALDGTWELDDSAEAQRAAQLADRGYLTGLSVGYVPLRSEWEFVADGEWDPNLGIDHVDKVTRVESRLAEVSLSPTPRYAGASVVLVRSSDRPATRRNWARLDRAEVSAWRTYLDEVRAEV